MGSFGVADYIVLVLTIVICLGIGIFYALRHGGQQTTSKYLLADRKMHVIPTSISLMVSFMSTVTILGYSSEMYYYGIVQLFMPIGQCIGAAVAMVFFVPLFFPLKVISVNEYLTQRFDSKFMVLLSCMVQIGNFTLLNGVIIFGSATMVQAMSEIPQWATMLVMGLVATLYTAIGGFKAVIWSDVFQAAVMFAGMLVILIQGSILTGGPSEVWSIYREQGRMALDWNPSPLHHRSVWNVLLIFVCMTAVYGVVQPAVQRYCSVKSITTARLSLALIIPGVLIAGFIACFSGVVVFSFYAKKGCDPLRAGLIRSPSQIVPYFVIDQLDYPAVPGLFVACVFCGGLSSISSALNSFAAMTWNDLLKAHLKHLQESRKTLVTKILSALFGLISTGFAFLVAKVKGTLIQVAVLLVTGGISPMVVMFVIGASFPRANKRTAILGTLVSVVFACWLMAGSIMYKTYQPPMHTITTNCSSTNLKQPPQVEPEVTVVYNESDISKVTPEIFKKIVIINDIAETTMRNIETTTVKVPSTRFPP